MHPSVCCWSTSIRRATRPWAAAWTSVSWPPPPTICCWASPAPPMRVQTAEGYDLLPGRAPTRAEARAGTDPRRVRLHPDRLPAGAVAADAQRAGRRRFGDRADAVRVLRPGRPGALVETIEALRADLNPALEIEGVLRTMFDVRNNLANAVSAELTEHFGDRVFRTIVPRNVRLAEAQPWPEHRRLRPRLARWRGLPGPGRRDHPPQQRTQQGHQGRGDRLMTSSKPAAKRGLGRGLDALLGPKGAVSQVQATTAVIEPLPGKCCASCRSASCSRANTSRAAKWTRASCPSWPTRSSRRA